MSRLRTNALRHVDGTSDNITFDSSTNATVAGNLTVSGTGNHSIAGTLQFNSGYGSAATAFGIRAWISFDGSSGTIGTGRGSGNMDAVTDNGTGNYTCNFTNNMPDDDYAVLGSAAGDLASDLFDFSGHLSAGTVANTTTSSCQILVTRNMSGDESDTAFDSTNIFVAFVR